MHNANKNFAEKLAGTRLCGGQGSRQQPFSLPVPLGLAMSRKSFLKTTIPKPAFF